MLEYNDVWQGYVFDTQTSKFFYSAKFEKVKTNAQDMAENLKRIRPFLTKRFQDLRDDGGDRSNLMQNGMKIPVDITSVVSPPIASPQSAKKKVSINII